jgi:hypothetical protein
MAQLVGGSIFAINVEAPPLAIGGALLAVHGMDDVISGYKKMVTGESNENATVQATASIAKSFGMNKNDALALGRALDLVLGLISPTGPMTGGPKLAPAFASHGSMVESVVTKGAPEMYPLFVMSSTSKVVDSLPANTSNSSPQLSTQAVAGKVWGTFFGLNKALDEKVALPTFTNLLERLSGIFLKEQAPSATVLSQVTLFTKNSKGYLIDTGRRVDFAMLFEKSDWLVEATTRNQLLQASEKTEAGIRKFEQLENFNDLVLNANHGGPTLFGRANGFSETFRLRRPSLLVGEYPIFEAISEGLYDLDKMLNEVRQLPVSQAGAKK